MNFVISAGQSGNRRENQGEANPAIYFFFQDFIRTPVMNPKGSNPNFEFVGNERNARSTIT